MRAVIQRINYASVYIAGKKISSAGRGLLIFLGVEQEDNEEDVSWLGGKIARLRIFNDENGVMNLDVVQVKGEIMVISQFTLHAKTKKGNRPSYIRAAPPETAIPLYHQFIDHLHRETGIDISTGDFGAGMNVELLNDGPVTIIIDTRNRE
jgi:D-aminoacyl-tRNA deacylase